MDGFPQYRGRVDASGTVQHTAVDTGSLSHRDTPGEGGLERYGRAVCTAVTGKPIAVTLFHSGPAGRRFLYPDPSPRIHLHLVPSCRYCPPGENL